MPFKTHTVMLAPNQQIAETLVEGNPLTVCIETSYGDQVVQGRLGTYDHHVGIWKKFPSPCNNPAIVPVEDATIVFSHVDLDSLGGAARLMPDWQHLFGSHTTLFWMMAEFIDLNGPHRLGQFLGQWPKSEEQGLRDAYHAYCAWSSRPENRARWPRDEATNITEHVESHLHALNAILVEKTPRLITFGKKWFSELDQNRIESFRGRHQVTGANGEIIFIGTYSSNGGFVNSFYKTPEGMVTIIVASYYKDDINGGGITVSFEDNTVIDELGFNARDIVQQVWPSKDPDTGKFLAGGHDTIAGCPRDITYLENEGKRQADLVIETIASMGPRWQQQYDGAF